MPAARRQVDLRARPPPAPQGLADRQPEVPRQFRRLVEPPRAPAPPVERHRHHAVGPGQHVGPVPAHQRGQGRRDRAAPLVLERVDDRAQRPLVRADRAPAADRARSAPAAGADAGPEAHASPGRQGVAADVAQRGRQRPDGGPARGADGAGRRGVSSRWPHAAQRGATSTASRPSAARRAAAISAARPRPRRLPLPRRRASRRHRAASTGARCPTGDRGRRRAASPG